MFRVCVLVVSIQAAGRKAIVCKEVEDVDEIKVIDMIIRVLSAKALIIVILPIPTSIIMTHKKTFPLLFSDARDRPLGKITDVKSDRLAVDGSVDEDSVAKRGLCVRYDSCKGMEERQCLS